MPALKNGLVFSPTAAGARIVPDAGVSLFHCEGAEATQLDALAASQSGSDLVEDRRNDQFSILLPQMRAAGGDFGDEFLPWSPPAQLDSGREFAPLLIDGADRSGLLLGDDEHR